MTLLVITLEFTPRVIGLMYFEYCQIPRVREYYELTLFYKDKKNKNTNMKGVYYRSGIFYVYLTW